MSKPASLCALLATLSLTACYHPEDHRWFSVSFKNPDPNFYKAVSDSNNTLCKNQERVKEEGGINLLAASPPTKDLGCPDVLDFPHVAVYSYATSNTVVAPSIKDLSDRGQAAALELIAQGGTKATNVRDALTKPLSTSASLNASQKDPNLFSRTLVATVTRGLAANPGDRLMWTWVQIAPVNFEFSGYTVIATDNEVLNIEHVQTQTTTSLQAQASAAPPGPEKPSVGLTGSVANQYQTSADVNQQYQKLGADILPRFLRIYRESERNQDVAGNTTITLSVKINPDKFAPQTPGVPPAREPFVLKASNLALIKNGRLLGPSNATIDTSMVPVPVHCPLIAKVRLIYQQRRIRSGEDYYLEGWQGVAIEKHATVWQYVELVPAD